MKTDLKHERVKNMSELVQYTDTIQEAADQAEYDVCMGLLRAYNKQLRMIEEGVDFTYFDDIVQEADKTVKPDDPLTSDVQPNQNASNQAAKPATAPAKQAVPNNNNKGVIDQAKGNANESKLKRILLFLPRLIAAILKKAFNGLKNLRNKMGAIAKDIKSKNPDAYAGKTFEFNLILTPNVEEGKKGVMAQLQFPRIVTPLNRIIAALNDYLNNMGNKRLDTEHIGTDAIFIKDRLDEDILLIQNAGKNKTTIKLKFVDADNAVSFVERMQKIYDDLVAKSDLTKTLDQLRAVLSKYNEKINDPNVGVMIKSVMKAVVEVVQPLLDKYAQLNSEIMNAAFVDMGEIRKVLNVNEDGEAAKNVDKNWDGKADEVNVLDKKTLRELLRQYINQQQHVLVVMIYHQGLILKDNFKQPIDMLKSQYTADGNPVAIFTYTPGEIGQSKDINLVRVIKSQQIAENVQELFDKNNGVFKYSGKED